MGRYLRGLKFRLGPAEEAGMRTQCLCGRTKSPNAKQCQHCANESRRQKLRGVKHPDERRRNISEARQRQQAAGHQNFDLAGFMRTQPHPFAAPVGAVRVWSKGDSYRAYVKCEDGRWRYRARLVWEREYGPIPRGRVIHHDNEDSTDDRPENLMCLTRAEHINIHRSL